MKKEVKKSFLGKVKERVDFVFSLITENPDGYHGGFQSFDGLTGDIVRDLVSRNIVAKERDESRSRLVFKYKWVAAMAPTPTLYKQIAVTVRETRRRYYSNSKARKQEKDADVEKDNDTKPTLIEQVESPIPIPMVEFESEGTLKGFSDKELWDELKTRGYYIEDNRLVLIKKEYLE